MPDCNAELFSFPSFDRRKIEASFSGGEVSSDGGVMVLRAADRRLGLVRALDAVIADPRDADLVTHAQVDLLRQRIYGLALGYEDLNDHEYFAQGSGLAERGRARRGAGQQPDVVPAGKSRRSAHRRGDVAGVGRAVHRELQGRARRADP